MNESEEKSESEEQIKLMGDRTFECGKQSLKVGAQGIQLWEGDKLIQSILYQQLQKWEEDEGKKGRMTIVLQADGKKKEQKIKLKTDESAEICAVMLEKAKEVKSAAKAAKK
eukprot:COSAG06_NODE_2333_length_7059_cov_109.820402_8_plen_112_part_00